MKIRMLFAALVVALLPGPCLWSQADPALFPVEEVRPGLKGVGRTVFEGDKIQEFQVEILGVLKNALAPKHDVIIARLSGGPLEKTGVIAGMSGSPVYVDGKLVGAVAISFPFSKEPLAGITPIQEMLDVVPEAKPGAPSQPVSNDSYRLFRFQTSSGDALRLIPTEDTESPDLSRLLPPSAESPAFSALRLPLRFGGFSQAALSLYDPLFRQLGFEPMQGGALAAGSAPAPPATSDLEPGSMISLLLVRGDLNLNIDCTVTYRQGDNLYACGHRILATGPVQFPFAPSRVLVTVPSIASSFKLDAPGPDLAGTIRQDRFNAIYGVVGAKPALIPVRTHIQSTLNKSQDYQFSMIEQPFLTPLLLNLCLVSELGTTERMMGPSTLDLKAKIRLSGGESVDVEDVLSSDLSSAPLAGTAVSSPVSYLLGAGFPDLHVEGVDINIVSRNEKRAASLEQVWSTKSEVRPGDHLEVTALLRLPSGAAITEKIPVDVPESVNDKTLSLIVGGGSAINALQFRFTPLGPAPRDLHQLVRALNRMRRNNRLYALLMAPQRSFTMQGDEYPSPPPSLLQTFLADPAVASSVTVSGTSVVGDFETKASPYTIRGQKMLILKVVGPGI